MQFYFDYDLGHLIRGWVIPDNPVAISRVFVSIEGRRVAEISANVTDDHIRVSGWHATGQCTFDLTDAQVPGLANAAHLEIHDAETNILVYRRVPAEGLVKGKVLLCNTSIHPESVIQAAMFEHFQQSYFGIGRLSEAVLHVLFDSLWLNSSFLSGSIAIPRYEGHFAPDQILTTLLIHDPFVELASRLLWLRERASVGADPAQAWRLGGLAGAATFAAEYDLTDARSLKRLFRMLPEPAYHLLYNPLTRQLGTKLPDDRVYPGNSIIAIEILARLGIVGHRDYFEAFVATLFDRLGIAAEVPVPTPIPAETLALADRLRSLKAAQQMLNFDRVMSDAVLNSVAKSWRN